MEVLISNNNQGTGTTMIDGFAREKKCASLSDLYRKYLVSEVVIVSVVIIATAV